MVKLRHQVGQQLKALLFTQGLIQDTDDTVLSKKWLRQKLAQVTQLAYPQGYLYAVNGYAEQWLHLTEALKQIKKELLAMQTLVYIYKSAPGIGDISALKLKDELGDMRQFSSEKKLFSYLGFTPVEHSSGEHVRQGHMSRHSRSVLRHLFVEAAWVAIKKDTELNTCYHRLAKTRGGKRAIVGVARRLAGRIRSCIQQGTLYEIKSLQNADAQAQVKHDLVAVPVAS